MNLYYEDFISQLLKTIPDIDPIYKEHIRQNFNELLPHVFMADYYRFLVSSYKKSISDASDSDHWHQIMVHSTEVLDQALGSDDARLQELILSFLENMDPREDEYKAIRLILEQGPNLRSALSNYYSGLGW